MDCKNCDNFKHNFKPKVHPLDEMIDEFYEEVLRCDMREYAKKLRYESMKWLWEAMCDPFGYGSLEKYLKSKGKESWIID